VTFVSGTLVLTDTLHDVFTSLVDNAYQHITFEVRGQAALGGSAGQAARNPIPESIVSAVRRVPGVSAADGSVTGYAQYVAPNGDPISGGGTGTAGLSFDPNSRLATFHLVKGTAPTTAGDVVMDEGTADKYHFAVAERVRILLPGPAQTFTITGIAKFGTADNLAGATLAAFDLPTAQRLFNLVGKVDTINVLSEPGADKASVQQAIARSLPAGVEVVTGQTVVNEETTTINQALSPLSTFLLVFALIALLVGAFTIFNTFSITVGQRTRELALLRIVGASRRQIFRSVLAEAAIVGLAASLVGLGLGVAAAKGLEQLLSAFGVTLPAGPLVFEPRTVVVALAVGVGVTVVSAISPARRAVRIPPVAAIAAHAAAQEVCSRRRILIGGVCGVISVVALGEGIAAPAVALVGLGAVGIFVAVTLLAPIVARPMAKVIGFPLARRLGVSGRLGRDNSMRNPRRTAQSAAALLVGLALVSAMAVYGSSLSKSATASVDNAISADLIITGPAGGFSTSIPPAVAHLPGVATITTVYGGQFEFEGSLRSVKGVPADHLSDTVILRMKAGTAETALTGGQLLIDTTTADDDHLSVGSAVPVKFARTGATIVRIGGIYEPNALIGSYLVSAAFFFSHFTNPLPIAVLARTDRSAGQVEQAVNVLLNPYANVGVQSRGQFEKSQAASINQLLGLVYALLALAVLIALIGILNTLMLSVFERTHEIGLLRAVGMKRRQIRAMIRSEALILSLFGAVIGIVVGTVLGFALVSSLKQSQNITDIVIPVTSLAVFLCIAALLGLGAASWPARRAAKLNVLAAIAAE
jgi:putative ABC transport system permease protein